MPRFMDSLLRRGKSSIPSDVLETSSVLNIREGESSIVIYTSAADKMKVFSAFVREGLEKGDAVSYIYPDKENENVRTRLKEHGVDVEKHEKDGALYMKSLTEYFMSNGKLDFKKEISKGVSDWAEFKSKGYKHIRDIQDLGDFSFINGQWQKYLTEYWLDESGWTEWLKSKDTVGTIWDSFIMEITAVNVERMTETQVTELLRAFGEGTFPSARFIDLLEHAEAFSKRINVSHQRLLGCKFLLEFDPTSAYEKVVKDFVKESVANIEPIFVFTSSTSPIRSCLTNQPAIKFFLTSISTSTPKSNSENEVFLPAKNAPLILDAIGKVLETYTDANVCFVFDILSELLTTIGGERTFTFLRQALDMLSSEKITSLFLLNTGAHETEVVSRLRNLFSNQLTYDRNSLEVVKTF